MTKKVKSKDPRVMKTILATLFIFLLSTSVFLNFSQAQLVYEIIVKCKDDSDCIMNECISNYSSDSEKVKCYINASTYKNNPNELTPSVQNHYARGIVIQSVEPNSLRVGGREFLTMNNPKGEGVFVYDPRTKFNGVERYLIWMVINEEAYPLNGASKKITPNLDWPRDADPKTWEKTGFSPYSATEAIQIVFRN